MTKIHESKTFQDATINLLVGGTPCQSFSIAGLRKGLADPRGNLMLTFLSLAERKKPRWIVWENVPGVLSSNGGKDFGTFLGALGELGYGFAYRVLDAQHFGVAQRRRRVFVVGYLGDWRPAAAVLFERESLSRDSKPSRKKREETPTDAQGGVGTTSFAGNVESQVAACLQTTCDDYSRADGFNTIIEQVAQPVHAFKVRGGCEGGGKGYLGEDEKAFTISTMQDQQVAQPKYFESHPQDSRVTGPHDIGNTVSAKYGMGGGNTPLVSQPIAIQGNLIGREKGGPQGIGVSQDGSMYTMTKTDVHGVAQPIILDDQGGSVMRVIKDGVCGTLRRETHGHEPLITQPIAVDTPTIIDRAAFNQGQNAQYEPRIEEGQTMSSLVARGPHAVQYTMAIRRLTPKECERLQGFPDDWTKIPYRKKPAEVCPDGPRYKACGNSMAVPVMKWIGERISKIEKMINEI
jgi:DNA (cytosine-5)-methyltransferase 1